ncbi:hypothetical protein BDN70DRAFT_415002 [Pholiota conissans]|uniref:Uncharacterized protein n=1 Tax=Pholiota conissans TaxID=109636 RepID=A0A9P6CTH0_9AGAR|nr:hypothetical protein BDN70DRAFT_415002 [Pholiota conissans]
MNNAWSKYIYSLVKILQFHPSNVVCISALCLSCIDPECNPPSFVFFTPTLVSWPARKVITGSYGLCTSFQTGLEINGSDCDGVSKMCSCHLLLVFSHAFPSQRPRSFFHISNDSRYVSCNMTNVGIKTLCRCWCTEGPYGRIIVKFENSSTGW